MSSSIIIVGAGASGLEAGRRLSAAGYRVILLEAAAEPGGRIFRLTPRGFSEPVEGGAEFVHGPLPLSVALATEAGIVLQPIKMQVKRGEPRPRQEEEDWDPLMGADWERLLQKMGNLKEDIPLEDFLTLYFAGERYAGLVSSVRGMAEGYDLADLRRVSARSLYQEWTKEEERDVYRPVGGYRRMIDFLVEVCLHQGAELHYSSPVKTVRWEPGRVEIETTRGRIFVGDRVLVSVPLGVLQAGELQFAPEPPLMATALQRLGYGSVTKIFLEFREPFWREVKAKERTLFIMSDQAIPTWWTQVREDSRVLTGWLAGERMLRFRQLDEQGKLDSCMRSLAAIFSLDAGWLRQELCASLALDWAGIPFIRGGYSFVTVGSAEARALLSQPHADTLYFCGEALYEGDVPGTVEAALCSGRDAAEKIIKSIQGS